MSREPLLPSDPVSRALAWILEEYADEVLGPLLYQLKTGRKKGGPELTPEELAAVEAELGVQCGRLESLLADKPYLLGKRHTLADLAVYSFVSRLEGRNPIPTDFPNLRAWYDRMKARG